MTSVTPPKINGLMLWLILYIIRDYIILLGLHVWLMTSCKKQHLTWGALDSAFLQWQIKGLWLYLNDSVLAPLDGLTKILCALRLQALVKDLLKGIHCIVHLLWTHMKTERGQCVTFQRPSNTFGKICIWTKWLMDCEKEHLVKYTHSFKTHYVNVFPPFYVHLSEPPLDGVHFSTASAQVKPWSPKLHIVDFAKHDGNRHAGRLEEELICDWRPDKAQLDSMEK